MRLRTGVEPAPHRTALTGATAARSCGYGDRSHLLFIVVNRRISRLKRSLIKITRTALNRSYKLRESKLRRNGQQTC